MAWFFHGFPTLQVMVPDLQSWIFLGGGYFIYFDPFWSNDDVQCWQYNHI